MKPIYQMATIAGGVLGAMLVIGIAYACFVFVVIRIEQPKYDAMIETTKRNQVEYERRTMEREKAIQDGTFLK